MNIEPDDSMLEMEYEDKNGCAYEPEETPEFCEPELEPCEEPEHPEDSMSDVEADADTLKSCGWGTEEDYGGAHDLDTEW